jgi:hypothetical protein
MLSENGLKIKEFKKLKPGSLKRNISGFDAGEGNGLDTPPC